MTSIDTNILLPAVESFNRLHPAAASFLGSLQERHDVALSEFVLLELYGLLRNPTVLNKPLTAPAALQVCLTFRNHPRWSIIGFPPDSREFHDDFWPRLGKPGFARRRAYDWRIALSLLKSGITEFATVNTSDFQGFGFAKVWNPLAD